MPRFLPRWLKLGLKTAVTVALISWVAYSADLTTLAARFGQASAAWLAVAMVVLFARHPLAALRLYYLVRPRLPTVRFGALVRDYFVGMFFNSFMPSATGGDVARTLYLSRYGLPLKEAASAVLVERILGMVVLITIPALGMVLGGGELPDGVAVAFLVGSGAVLLGGGLLFSSPMGRVVRRLERSSLRPLAKVAEFVRIVHRYRHPRGPFLAALFWSLPYQLATIVGVYALGASLAPGVGLATYLLLFPVVGIVSMLPITLNGTGVRESAFVVLFTQAGMARETASAVSLLLFGTIVLQAAVGGVFFALPRTSPPTVAADPGDPPVLSR